MSAGTFERRKRGRHSQSVRTTATGRGLEGREEIGDVFRPDSGASSRRHLEINKVMSRSRKLSVAIEMDLAKVPGDTVKDRAIGLVVLGNREQPAALPLGDPPRLDQKKPTGRIPPSEVVQKLTGTTTLGGDRGLGTLGGLRKTGPIQQGGINVRSPMKHAQELQRIEVRIGFHKRTAGLNQVSGLEGGVGGKATPNWSRGNNPRRRVNQLNTMGSTRGRSPGIRHGPDLRPQAPDNCKLL